MGKLERMWKEFIVACWRYYNIIWWIIQYKWGEKEKGAENKKVANIKTSASKAMSLATFIFLLSIGTTLYT
jgi:hypothetical protein